MGLTAAEWKQVSANGVEILGDGWVALGKGRNILVWRIPVEWWAQFVYYENTSAGRFAAWGGLLAKPMPTSSQTGDDGHSLKSIQLRLMGDWARYRTMKNARDPVALANFAQFTEVDRFSPSRELESALEESDRQFQGWQGRWDNHPYYSNTRQLLVMLRVFSGSRSLPELIEDVRWVLDDEDIENARRNDAIPGRSRRFYGELLETLEAADRPAMENLLLRMRSENLAELGVPDEYIADVSVPEPKVPW